MQIKILGRIRKILEGIDAGSPGDDEQLVLNEQLEQLVAMGASPYGEITKMGRAFETHTTAALAAVVAVPTVGNMLSIYNNEPEGGRSYVIDRAWAQNVVSTAVASQCVLIGCLGQTRVAALASAALAINALNGLGGKDTRAINGTANLDAVTGVVANWRVLPGQTGGLKTGAVATPGYYSNSQIDGRIIVPPGRLFAIHVLANVVGETFIGGIEWHERQFKLG